MVYTWMGLRWPGETVAVLASGPSMSEEQAETIRDWRAAAPGRKVIAINTTFRRAPWADVLYACDVTWWEHYHAEAASDFKGELWSQDRKARDKFGVHWIESAPKAGLGKEPALIHQGQNSGYQAINLAYQAGAKRMFLLGFDMKGTHWHGEHPLPMTNPKPYLFDAYRSNFMQMANDLRTAGVEVINCTPDSALHCFLQMPLWVAMAGEAIRAREGPT